MSDEVVTVNLTVIESVFINIAIGRELQFSHGRKLQCRCGFSRGLC